MPTARWRHVDLQLRAIDSKRQRPVAFENLVYLESATIERDVARTGVGTLHGQRERAINRAPLELRPELEIVVRGRGDAPAYRCGLRVDHPSG